MSHSTPAACTRSAHTRAAWALSLVLLAFHATSGASAAQGVPAPNPPDPARAAWVQHDFVEIPGVRELSSRMIARPWPRRALRDAGLPPEQVAARVAAARREIRRQDVLHHVAATDDYIIRVLAGMTEEQVADRLMDSGSFQYVEPDWILYPIGPPIQVQVSPPQGQVSPSRPGPTSPVSPRLLPPFPRCPDDPLFASQWHHQAGIMDSCLAWGGPTGGPGVSIAFCDTGLRTTHEDLQLHRLEGYNAVNQLWESEGGAIQPVMSHGTRTTGTAAANGNNGLGVAGVGWNFSHRMVRVSNSGSGNAFLSVLQYGARTAIEAGDRIANVSYHGASSASNAGTASYIKSLGGLILWGSGNNSANMSHADRDADDLIVVGATDQNDGLAWFSAYGTFVDLVAPGMGIVTTDSFSDTSYATVEGTSYACPLTAGVCAMIWNARPTLSPNDVERILKLSAEDLGAPGLDLFFGYGRVHLARALQGSWSAPPVADFAAATPVTGVSPLAVTFTDLSTGVPTSWSWDFGDGGSSTLQNPVHIYLTSGTFTVTLTVSNSLGMDTGTQLDAVLVDVIPPVADFSASVTGGLSPLDVTFTDQSTGGVPATWLWDFGDGTTSTVQHPAHTYVTSGFYTVSLSVTNPYGSDSLTRSSYIAVDFIPPVAGFSAVPTSGASPYVATFSDESTAGIATSWTWTFGDGGGSSSQNPLHTYTAAGSYSVMLTASNAYGSDTLWRTGYIEVLPGPPLLADFVGTPTTGTAPFQVDFTDLSIGNITSWDWNFGDGGMSTLQHPSHIFTAPGEHDIALSVANGQGKDSGLELQAYITVQ